MNNLMIGQGKDVAWVSFSYPGHGKLGKVTKESDLANEAGKQIGFWEFLSAQILSRELQFILIQVNILRRLSRSIHSLHNWVNDKVPSPFLGLLNNFILRYKPDNVALASKVSEQFKVLIMSSANDEVTSHFYRRVLLKYFKDTIELKNYGFA